ncbi:unnamed protein product [Oikopleura dioica]|uniref:Phospholipase A2-like central domain-containing protein n=1 Tax=Oikopleura dioica TaxID=34765 RepID=E4X7K6_OIKDI|nr:unnamed protein product [Oikopleura dioica]
MKLLPALAGLLATTNASLDMTNLDMPNDDAFAWLEPKTRIRREGDQDDQQVKEFSLQREQLLSEEEAIRQLKKLIKMRLEEDPDSGEIALLKSALKKKKKRADNYWKNKSPTKKQSDEELSTEIARGLMNKFKLKEVDAKLNEEVTLLDNELMQLIEKIKREKGGEGLTFSHEDGHVPKVKGFNRRNLGRKLTEEEQNQREKIRAARRRRKELRRLEQIRRKEWRLAHQNPETGDYDDFEYAEYQFAVLNAGRMDDFEGIQTLEKYQLLKLMMIYLQPREFQNWNRFSQYGCHCFQSFDTEFWKGKGVPKDDIDKTCRKLGMCYHCIKNDNPDGACDPLMQYDFMGLQDPTTGDRFIECLNEPGSCQRNICECDRQMAMSLSKQTETFNINYDPMWGAFDASASCTEKIGSPPWDQCCGNYPERMPYASSGTRSCCNGKTFEKIFNKCCNDRVVSKGNTCNA